MYNTEQYNPLLRKINAYHKILENRSNEELKGISVDLLKKYSGNKKSEEIVITGFGLVKEVIRRQLELIPYDVQIIGGLALYQNKLIEMQTGEGKTLTAIFAAYLKALDKKGVHILTFNDYLAKRDANWMRPVYEFLGLSVGFVQEGMSAEEKRSAYQCDITYATAKEVGFDYLRTYIAYQKEEIVLRPFHYCIVDEADALLIDEARNPLVLAGDIIKSGIDFPRVSEIVATMGERVDFDIDEYSRNIYLTDKGIERIEKELLIQNLQDDQNYELHSAVNLAIHARMMLKRDIDYVIRNSEIKLVDEFTGRIVEDRKWRNGLQTAIEAKEGLKIQSEGNILNSISMQHFINQYPEKSGMTATAKDSEEEFHDFYRLDVIVIPPNIPSNRIDFPDEIFTTVEGKTNALTEEIKRVNQSGQPVLIGTLTVKESEQLADKFRQNGIICQVLNAKNDELEAEIIANAGKIGVVTISTNMAGRGTDILLGGIDEKEKNKVVELGGLYVIGTNRHESNRIDKQLRGRAGRQGDIGMSRFFVSLEDTLMVKYKLKEALPKRFRNMPHDHTLTNKYVNRFIEHIQHVIEGQSYDIRRTLVEYSDLVEKQRAIVQKERQKMLFERGELFKVAGKPVEHTENEMSNGSLESKLKESFLFQYDKYWATHLDYLQAIRDSIHLVRIGGQNPLREFQKKADQSFTDTCTTIDKEIQTVAGQLLKQHTVSLADIGIKKPASTWTYMINDNPFGNQLSVMLLDSSNIGLLADPFSNIMLGLYGIVEKIRSQVKKKQLK